MTTRLLLLADTHVPKRARDLPAAVWVALDRADVVVHAGDWVDPALLDAMLRRLPPPARLVGVHGNNDGGELRQRLPEVARTEIEDLTIAVVHDTGNARGREARCDADPRLAGADVLAFGHSHIPWDSTTPSGMRLLNPGSPTDRRRQPHCTYLTAVVDGAALTRVTLHRLPPSGGSRAAAAGAVDRYGGR